MPSTTVGSSENAAHIRYLCSSDLDTGAATVPFSCPGTILMSIDILAKKTAPFPDAMRRIQNAVWILP